MDQEHTGIYKPETEDETQVGFPCKVVVFNDDWHTFEEVIEQIIKAINCSFEEARAYSFEIHVKGRAIVFIGDLSRCLKVSSILEEIALHTQILSE